jgi:hypothetical protein
MSGGSSRNITLSLFTDIDISRWQIAGRLLDAIAGAIDGLRFDSADLGIKQLALYDLDYSPLASDWQDSAVVVIGAKAPVPTDLIFTNSPSGITPRSIALTIGATYFGDPTRVANYVEMVAELANLVGASYGRAHDTGDFLQLRKTSLPEVGEVALGIDLHRGLPGIYWLNVLGPSIIKRVGAERLRSASAMRQVDLPYGGVLLQMYTSPNEFDMAENRNAIKSLIDHVGSEAFDIPYPSWDG